MLHALIMAGGSGTRFWPASRARSPKQVLPLHSGRTLIQETYDRVRELTGPERTWVMTSEALAGIITEQLPELPPHAILGEPCRRDTAPCIGLAAGLISRSDPEATMLVMPADHVIHPVEAFQTLVNRAVRLVDEEPRRIVTFGIRPSYPAETYGYLERGEPLVGSNVYRVRMFREKPDAATARQYLATGSFYWNSGIFLWRARTIGDALAALEPGIAGPLAEIVQAAGTPAFAQRLRESFARATAKSIDYAVMEKYPDVVVIEAPFDWDDVGSWGALARLRGVDDHGNTVIGRHLGIETRGCIIRGDDEHLIATLGLEDCIVVHTPDATFVARKSDEESVRQVVELLRQRGWDEYL